MTVFRPAAKVTAPDGREWEIYAFKIKVRERDEMWDVEDPLTRTPAESVFWLFEAVVWFLLLIPHALMRLYDIASGAARSVRSDEWTVEAVSWVPSETRFAWTTTTEFKGQVLAQVEGHLARGDLPLHLTNAVYRGESRSAR
jgi:hypothetical protein